jgi:hypothetical protein
MKKIVVTLNVKSLIHDLTLIRIKNYSKKIGSDFKLLEISEDALDYFLEFDKLLQNYDRILYISPFILIRPDTPSLFDIVPIDSLGMFNEGRYINRTPHMQNVIALSNEKLSKDWDGKYYNFDVIVLSKKHRRLFTKPKIENVSDITSALNLRLHNSETKMFDLPYVYNRMEFLDSKIGISRLDSYLINYTGAPKEIIRDIVEKDIKQWEEDSPKYEYKRNILIRLSAGLGDQVESEPVARYVRKIYPEANIFLTTHHPRIFKHLEKIGIKVFDYANWEGIKDALLVMENNPPEGKTINNLTQVLFHPTDYSSISMLRRTLPSDEKNVHIDIDPQDVESVIELLKDRNKDKKIIVVHPGKWWPSKTFPKKWWQDVVDLLSERLSVVLIGKTLSEEQGYLDIKCPKDGFDFRDFTTLGENITLISLSEVTLSNDSSPVHIAGAFDNWIVVVPTSKHPDHILPWRNGSQRYKTKAIFKKLLQDDLEVRYTEFYFDTIDKLPKDKKIDEYLPEPKEVVTEIFKIYEASSNK